MSQLVDIVLVFKGYDIIVMTMSDSLDLDELIGRENKLQAQLNHKISVDYNDLMKNVGGTFFHFQGMQESTAQYYKQKANEELDKMERDIESDNILNAINDKLMADTYISLATTL
ncbi:MAG: hypothetical protein ACR2IS_04315 [Nitrososphaeraceae archaeon]